MLMRVTVLMLATVLVSVTLGVFVLLGVAVAAVLVVVFGAHGEGCLPESGRGACLYSLRDEHLRRLLAEALSRADHQLTDARASTQIHDA